MQQGLQGDNQKKYSENQTKAAIGRTLRGWVAFGVLIHFGFYGLMQMKKQAFLDGA